MTWKIKIHCPGLPVAQPRHRVAKVQRGRRAGQSVAYIPKGHRIHAFKQQVSLLAQQVVRDYVDKDTFPVDGPVFLAVLFCFGVKDDGTRWRSGKPDLDNLVKAVKDALTGVVYLDDAQVVEEHLFKVNCGDRSKEGVTIYLTGAGDAQAVLAYLEGLS